MRFTLFSDIPDFYEHLLYTVGIQ